MGSVRGSELAFLVESAVGTALPLDEPAVVGSLSLWSFSVYFTVIFAVFSVSFSRCEVFSVSLYVVGPLYLCL